jgi:hypothetical protein
VTQGGRLDFEQFADALDLPASSPLAKAIFARFDLTQCVRARVRLSLPSWADVALRSWCSAGRERSRRGRS